MQYDRDIEEQSTGKIVLKDNIKKKKLNITKLI
jgi:hypothetical protein